MATLATDNFNRANGGLGSSWTTITSENAPAIVSNAVQGSVVGSGNAAYYNGVTWPNDQWSEVILAGNATSVAESGAIVRAASGAQTYYQANAIGTFGASTFVRLQKFVAGAYTEIDVTTTTVATNDALRLEAQGATLRVKIAGSTVITATDSSIASGNAGVGIYVDSGSTADAKIDTWQGGDFSSGSAGGRNRTLMGFG